MWQERKDYSPLDVLSAKGMPKVGLLSLQYIISY
jgi:hypothetical protein